MKNLTQTGSLRGWACRCGGSCGCTGRDGRTAEFHYQYGKLTNPFDGAQHYTHILTFQQASSWSLGDSFFFIDLLDDGVTTDSTT